MSKYGRLGDVIVGIDFALDDVTGLEIDKAVGAGADRLQVGRRIARFGARIISKQVLGDHHAACADKRIRPERRRLGKVDDHRVVVNLLDLDVLVAANGRGSRCGIGSVLPVEHDVVGSKRLTVVPLDAPLQLPGHRHAVGSEAAVLAAWIWQRDLP